MLIILLAISALISGSEVAYFSLSPKEKEKIKIGKDKYSTLIKKNMKNPEKLLATILIANNFVNIGIIILSTYINFLLFDFSDAPTLEFIFQVIIITFLLLLFGEIIPKLYANRYSIKMARIMSTPLYIILKILNPINVLLIRSSSFITVKGNKVSQESLSVNELSQALKMTEGDEISDEKKILEGIVTLGNKSAVEIMKSRVDIITLDLKDSFDKVVKTINECNYSRIPVCMGSFDNIKGILYTKDILPHLNKDKNFRWQSITRLPFYVPETKKIDDLLSEFQKNKVHLAIVVDEYGGCSGIVTMEDILEEIVGNRIDETDEGETYSRKIDNNKYYFEGKTLLNDFYRITACDPHVFDNYKGDAETLAGLLLEMKGEMPHINDKFKCENFTFYIEAVDYRRIKKIKVEIDLNPLLLKKNK
ncbi:MAG: gliding motility-associated protein GldE [Prolixibacteraceae bacterium]|nr:gliding motility-associated protein GldE [Prolixibacteraceae bacterium]